MDRLDRDIDSKWHRALNDHNQPGGEFKHWMYEAKHMRDEIPRMTHLHGLERLGQLPKLHRQCSQSPAEPVPDNHLTCCLGVKCRECPALLALEKAELPPEQIDELKAWTCASHILDEKGKRQFLDTSEGYLLTVDDRMYWERVYSSLAGSGDPDMDKLARWGY